MRLTSILPKRAVGIDIGTSYIRVVELSSIGGRLKLENYGEISSKFLYQKPFRTFEKNTLLLSSQEIAKALKGIFEEAKIFPKKLFFSIPDFASFFTTFELPPMTKEELNFAVEAEARRHIPVPLMEVSWDWQLLERKPIGKKEMLRILMVAVPTEVINQYQHIANLLKLENPIYLEAEVFSLARALASQEKVVAIVDIGARTTSCSIIDKGTLKMSHSFDLSGDDLTERIAKSMDINYNLAEELKMKYGLIEKAIPEGRQIREILLSLIDIILKEVNQTMYRFYNSEGREVEKIILAGGSANLPGLLDYTRDYFKKETEVANPFKKIFFPPVLDAVLKESGPSFSIAVGLALRGLQ